MKNIQAILILVCLCGISTWAVPAQAGPIIFELSYEFSGATQPNGTPPWLRATFTDVPGGVSLKMESLLQSSSEFVSNWYFNLDPMLNPLSLTINYLSGGPLASSISRGVNAFQADGDGLFDIRFTFSNAGPNRFNGTDSVTYMITSPQTIAASSFAFSSVEGGGAGTYYSAAHVQGINDNDSGWVGTDKIVPEPGTAGLLLCTLGLIAVRRRRAC